MRLDKTDLDNLAYQARLRASRKCADGYAVPFDVNLDIALADAIGRLTKDRDEARKWERLHEVELSRTMLVLGQRFTLVPPDGGDVRPREAAKSAIEALAAAEARVAELEAALNPFAAMPCGICENDDPAIGVERCSDDTPVYVTRHDHGGRTVAAGHFRTARAALGMDAT